MVLSMVLGTLVGVVAGYFRRLDGVLMRLTDLFLALPLLPLLLLMVMLFREPLVRSFGPEGGIFILIVVAIGVTSWMHTARIVRGDVLALKEQEFVLASRSIGTPARRMILRHILPNVMSPIMVSATLGVANAVITGKRAELPRPRLPAGLPDLGAAPERRAALYQPRAGAGALARPRPVGAGAVDQLYRRRAAGRARPPHQGAVNLETAQSRSLRSR